MTQAKQRLIKITYETCDPEGTIFDSGFENSEGVRFGNVLEAAAWLKDEGAVFASASTAEDTRWFSSEPSIDFETGIETTRAFHPQGFPDREIASLFYAVEGMSNSQTLDGSSLSHCSLEAFEDFALLALKVDEENMINHAIDTRLVGKHAIVAYLEQFGQPGLPRETYEFKSMASHLGYNFRDFQSIGNFFRVLDLDAIYFGITATPIIHSGIQDGKTFHNLMSVKDFIELANANNVVSEKYNTNDASAGPSI